VRASHVDGSNVSEAAIKLPACSFNREKFSSPNDVLSDTAPAYNGIAFVTVAKVPQGVIESSYEFVVAHDPRADNYSHTEVRVKRTNKSYNKNLKVADGEVRLRLREALASTLEVLQAPVPVPDEYDL
jgi:hypothetical protein